MPIRTTGEKPNRFTYYLVCYDALGREREEEDDDRPDLLNTHLSDTVLKMLDKAQASGKPFTDVFIMSHGWKGGAPQAVEHYDKWIGAMSSQHGDIDQIRGAAQTFNPLIIGIHWPSQWMGDESLNMSKPGGLLGEDDANYTDHDVNALASEIAETDTARQAIRTILENTKDVGSATELPPSVLAALSTLKEESGMKTNSDRPPEERMPDESEAAANLTLPEIEPDVPTSGELGVIRKVANAARDAALLIVRQFSFWTMKDRARLIGDGAGHEFLGQIQEKAKGARIHLMGHSFGCIVVSGMIAGAPESRTAAPAKVDSLFLVQGALSLWAYAGRNPFPPGSPGHYYPLLSGDRVRGVTVATNSDKDVPLRNFYPAGAWLKQQRILGGPAEPEYGAVGTWGICGLEENVLPESIKPVTEQYNFKSGKVYNLQSNEVISGHSSFAFPAVAHAYWQAVLSSILATAASRTDLQGQPPDSSTEPPAVPSGQDPTPRQQRWLNLTSFDREGEPVVPTAKIPLALQLGVDTKELETAIFKQQFNEAGLAFNANAEISLKVELTSIDDSKVLNPSRILRVPASGNSRTRAQFVVIPGSQLRLGIRILSGQTTVQGFSVPLSVRS